MNLSFLSLDRTGQELIGPVAPHPAPAQHLRDLPPPALVGLVPASDGKAPHTASLSLLLHRKGNRGSESRWVWLLGTGEDDSGPRTLPQAASSAHEGPLSLSSFCPHGCSGGRGRESRGSSSFLLTGLASWQVSHFPLPQGQPSSCCVQDLVNKRKERGRIWTEQRKSLNLLEQPRK